MALYIRAYSIRHSILLHRSLWSTISVAMWSKKSVAGILALYISLFVKIVVVEKNIVYYIV